MPPAASAPLAAAEARASDEPAGVNVFQLIRLRDRLAQALED
jgi:hypothetical protein